MVAVWILVGLSLAVAVGALTFAVRVTRQQTTARAIATDNAGPLPDLARTLFERLSDPVMLLDAERRVLFANQAMRQIVGGDFEHKHVSSLLRTPSVLEAIERTTKTGEAESLEFAFPVPVERHYEAHVSRTGANPQITIVLLHDMTTVRRTEQMRADFVANASHELRTPLAAVSGFIDTLRGHARDDSEAREKFLGIMSVEAGRMRRLIEDLLSLTRIELNEHVRPSGVVRIEDVVRDASATLMPLASADDIHVEIGPASGLPAVRGERDELIQLFQNLIHNAIKYGGNRVRISFGVTPGRGERQAGNFVYAAIKDDGEGIPADAIPRLTERFYRVDVKRSRERGGTGLGLAIVKHIVNRHQGRLQIESKAGEGSTFTVFLPAVAETRAAVTELL
jgi:two-component system phosphate regulon sensor histidine kinase PhoR